MRRTLIVLVVLSWSCGLVAQEPRAATPDGPLSTDDALAAFVSESDLRVELVAAEPDVVDPIALAFDESGELWVVEARGYPVDDARGVIATLVDADGDGRYERQHDFATGLRFPNGVLPWRGGAFVTDAPEVLYLQDVDGDGKADRRDVVLTGFATDRSTQLRVNDPTLGLDGRVYLAGGLSGGRVSSPLAPEAAAIDLRRSDVCFDPATGAFSAADGKSQYGHCFDDFGRRFICMNRIQAQHVVIASRVLERNPRLAFSDTVEDLPVDRVDDLLRGRQNAAARIYPLSDNVTTADSHAGTFSAACAVTVWRGGALPARLVGQVLSCDPTGNLVHRDELTPRGATFTAKRSDDKRELLASPDNWFRPVFLASGPDGALYVCDMYRRVIEHPDYLPDEVRRRSDFSSGRDRGRIYRVRAADESPAQPTRFAADATPADLAQALRSEGYWARETAFRMLVERGIEAPGDDDRAARDAATRRVLTASAADHAPAAAAALGLLAREGRLTSADLQAALGSPHAGLREVAVTLAAPRLGDATEPALLETVVGLASDGDARVRFAVAIALGDAAASDAAASARDDALASIARRDAADRWTRAAVISSASGRELALLERLLAGAAEGDAGERSELLFELARAASGGEAAGVNALVARLLAAEGPDAPRVAVLNGLARGGYALEGGEALDALAARVVPLAFDAGTPPAQRERVIELIGNVAPDEHAVALAARVVGAAGDGRVEIAAVRAIARAAERDALAAGLLARWTELSVAVREAVLSRFVARPKFAVALLDAIEAEKLAPAALSAGHREALLAHDDAALRERAERLLTAAEADRVAVYERLKAAATTPGDAARGLAVFREHCAPCHRLDREGIELGPDLYGVRNQPKEAILLHLLVPNREITPGFEASIAVTRDGESLTGIVTSRTPTSVTLKLKGGEERALHRDDLTSLTVSPLSLMPDGLETSTTPQGIADLLAYLRGEG